MTLLSLASASRRSTRTKLVRSSSSLLRWLTTVKSTPQLASSNQPTCNHNRRRWVSHDAAARRVHQHPASLSRRTYATLNDSGRIAVVGGGLTGLTTAYYLAKQLPTTAKITLYEGSDRLGGWIRTDRVPVDVDGVKGTVSFERGPRTLSSLHTSTWRFDDLVLYDLVLDLGLTVHSPPDQPRYIYYPDHLVKLPPNTVSDLVREPLFLQSFWAGLGFMLRRLRSRAVPLRDMSISEWLYEVTGSRSVAENFASSMIHGIYGGDIDKLSARSVFDRFYWAYYLPSMGANVKQMTEREQVLMSELSQNLEIRKMALKAKGSLLHFGNHGMDSLTKALEDVLTKTPNVEIKKGRPVTDIGYDKEIDRVNVTTGKRRNQEDQQQQHQLDQQTESYDRVISTLASQDLARITSDKLPSLAETHSVSIMTVNMWYPQENMKPPGFGYLIPRSVSREHNTERALGVFYDSDVSAATSPDEPPGTKLFVLMGGHYYDSGAPPPSESDAIEQAKSLLERHLGIPADTPCFALSRFAKECIPQHYVGHIDRMMQADQELRDSFSGKLAVAGGSYTKIGAMGAIRAGYDIAKQTVRDSQGWYTTGLEQLEFPEPFVGVPIHKIPVRRFRQLDLLQQRQAQESARR
ncbi:oxygen-dependent protoporphyrinogen oxidase [Conoideocrella luteorostrata]|uniref:Protoporphyrinogen oxidase n=1 Tax=Conoideocrella luteorostrata TaxID=1105319 RepID=A0AAJ0CF07_9HYPO|nr:oxygen-dependent protoporphyrinogen oxidase [Conoideocrella luteorostrata]